MSDTPITDAAARLQWGAALAPEWPTNSDGSQEVVLAEVARSIERELAAVTAERDEARAELARALRDRDNALELAAQVCVDEVNRNMDEYTRLPQNFSRRVIYAAMGVAATNCRDGIREIIDSRSNNEAGR